jgi:hypothetical protein
LGGADTIRLSSADERLPERRILPLAEAKVSVLDRGLSLAMASMKSGVLRKPFRLDEHLRACRAAWTAFA